MNTKLSVLKALVLVMLILGSIFGNIPMTFAQNTGVEPNHPHGSGFWGSCSPFYARRQP